MTPYVVVFVGGLWIGFNEWVRRRHVKKAKGNLDVVAAALALHGLDVDRVERDLWGAPRHAWFSNGDSTAFADVEIRP